MRNKNTPPPSAGRRFLKKAWQSFAIGALKFLQSLAKVVPLAMLLPIGAGLGTLGYLLSKRYRSVGIKNLKLAYGDELSEAQRRRITRSVFCNFGKAVIEFPYVATLPAEAVRKVTHLGEEDRARLDKALSQGRGLIAFTAHMGNFELMSRRFTVEGYNFTVVVRNDSNAVFTQVINEIRAKGGYSVIGRGDAARSILKHLRVGGVIGMLPDQKAEDVFVPFFGRLSGTVAGPAVFALRTGAPMVPMYCIRQPDNTHKIEVWDPIDTTATADVEADIRRIMTEVNKANEAAIRKHPDQWLWIHDRWKALPPAEAVAAYEAKGQLPSSAC